MQFGLKSYAWFHFLTDLEYVVSIVLMIWQQRRNKMGFAVSSSVLTLEFISWGQRLWKAFKLFSLQDLQMKIWAKSIICVKDRYFSFLKFKNSPNTSRCSLKTFHWSGGGLLLWYILRQWDNIPQKNKLNSFTPSKITKFSGVNSARVARRWIGKDDGSLISQSGRAFHSIHFVIIY